MIRQAGIYILFLFVFCSIKSRASGLSIAVYQAQMVMDTVPVAEPVKVIPAEQSKPVDVSNVIKQVPKSRKQVKPVAVPKIVTTRPKAIIKPKIVIKAGLIH